MNKIDIENKLNELKDCEIAKFTMETGIQKLVHLKDLKNYPEIEFVEANHPLDNFASTYLDIINIEPFA